MAEQVARAPRRSDAWARRVARIYGIYIEHDRQDTEPAEHTPTDSVTPEKGD